MTKSRPSTRGRPARLSRDDIVAVAKRLLEASGGTSLSMRRIAEELGSSPMSIYRHVESMDHLIVLVLDELAKEIPKPELADDPKERLVVLWLALYDCLAANPWAQEVLAKEMSIGPSILWFVEEIIKAFVDGGLPLKKASQAYNMVWKFSVGTLMIDQGLTDVEARSDGPSVARQFMMTHAEGYPTLKALMEEAPNPDHRGRERYVENLKVMLDGIPDWK